ncbi:11-beta-hydroxysteroid dehydrogenase type 2-like [Saccoglossus kowalevskii]
MANVGQIIVRYILFILLGIFVYIIYDSLFPLVPIGKSKFAFSLTPVPFKASIGVVIIIGVWIYMLPAKRLEVGRKSVLVTGCDSGFGHALAIYLDLLGFHVFAGCLFKDGEGAKELRNMCSERLTILQFDVTSQIQVDNALEEVNNKLKGELWGLVNNAGILHTSEFELTPTSVMEQTMEINCLGPMRVTKAFLPLIRNSKGRIVNVASIAGRVCVGLHTVYAASKAGVELFSDGLRQEMVKWGVNVSIIEPAGFKTTLFSEKALESMYKSVKENMTPTVKKDYGEAYMKSFQDSLMSLSKMPKKYLPEDISPVIDSIYDALLSTQPKPRYTIGTGKWFMLFIGNCLPTKIGDRFLLKLAPKTLLPAALFNQNKNKDV